MGNLRIDNGREIWKKIDKEESDSEFGEFYSSSIYKPKKFKESNLTRLYETEDRDKKKRNKNMLRFWVATILVTICLIVIMVTMLR